MQRTRMLLISPLQWCCLGNRLCSSYCRSLSVRFIIVQAR